MERRIGLPLGRTRANNISDVAERAGPGTGVDGGAILNSVEAPAGGQCEGAEIAQIAG